MPRNGECPHSFDRDECAACQKQRGRHESMATRQRRQPAGRDQEIGSPSFEVAECAAHPLVGRVWRAFEQRAKHSGSRPRSRGEGH